MIRLVLSIWSATGPEGTRWPPDPAGPAPAGGAAARMAASSSAGTALVIWAAAVYPADVPMIRSLSVTSSPASNRPAMTPINHALPVDPPPPRTSARSPAARIRLVAPTCGCSWPDTGWLETVADEMRCRGEEGCVFMGVAFRQVPGGRSRRLPQSRDPEREGSTHCGYCGHGSHLLVRITIAGIVHR